MHCGFYFIFIQRAILYKHTLSSRIHAYNIISAHCALPISPYYCVQSYTLTRMHANVLFSTIVAHTLICIIKILFCLNLSILSILHPGLWYSALTAKKLKIYSHFLARLHATPKSSITRSRIDQHVSHQLHLCVKSPNLSNHINSPHQQSKPTNACFLSRQNT